MIDNRSGFLNQTCFDRFNADPQALYLTGREANFDTLQIRTEFAFSCFGYVSTDAAAFLALPLAVDDTARCGSFACDCTNSCHDWNLLRTEEKRVGVLSWQAVSWEMLGSLGSAYRFRSNGT